MRVLVQHLFYTDNLDCKKDKYFNVLYRIQFDK